MLVCIYFLSYNMDGLILVTEWAFSEYLLISCSVIAYTTDSLVCSFRMPLSCFSWCQSTEDNGVKEIDLSNSALHDVPPSIFLHERTLDTLYLNSNRVSVHVPTFFHSHTAWYSGVSVFLYAWRNKLNKLKSWNYPIFVCVSKVR